MTTSDSLGKRVAEAQDSERVGTDAAASGEIAPHKLAVSAPRREWYRTDNGWATRAWTKEKRWAYELEAGGWFDGTEDKAETFIVGRPQYVTAPCRCDKHKRGGIV